MGQNKRTRSYIKSNIYITQYILYAWLYTVSKRTNDIFRS